LDYDKALKVTCAELLQGAADFFDLHRDVREFRIEKRRDGY
jgi:hypothetical protein